MKTLWTLVGCALIFSWISSQPPQYNNIKAEAIPEGVERLRTTKVLEETVVVLPTVEYLSLLNTLCLDSSSLGRDECLWRLNEVRKGQSDINARLNPLYGRAPFDEKQLQYVVMGATRTLELLEKWEREFASELVAPVA